MKISNQKIAIIGDLIIDEDKHLVSIGTSLETPTIKGYLSGHNFNFGGAGNLVLSFNILGIKPYFFSFIGNDYYNTLKKNLKFENKVKKKPSNSNIKTRFWAKNYKLLQVNQDMKLNEKDKINIIKNFLNNVNENRIEKIIISDYGGIFDSKRITDFFYEMYFKNNFEKNQLFIDSQFSSSFRITNFKYSNYFFLNEKEYKHLCKIYEIDNSLSLKNLSFVMNKLCIQDMLIVKLGKNGSLSFDGKKIIKQKVKTIENIINEAGAGDFFLAAYVYSLSRNENRRLSFANKFASSMIK